MMKIVPRNIMEDLVDTKVRELMRSSDMCCCERCRADVEALALNKLPPRYVVSTSGDVYSHFQAMNVQTQANITSAIINGIRIVSKFPHHGIE